MGGSGIRRLAVAHGPGGWTVEERWTSSGLKPYFNDFVVHKGHAFGFDGSILACIDLADGTAQMEGRTLRQRPARAAARPGPAAGAVGGRRAGAGRGDARPVHGARARSGDRGQDLEPPGAGRRRPAGSQRRGDGRVPAVPRSRVAAGAGRQASPRNRSRNRYEQLIDQPRTRSQNRSGCGRVSSRSCCCGWSVLSFPLVAPDAAIYRRARRGRRRAGDRRVVAVLQPRALVRAPGRPRR